MYVGPLVIALSAVVKIYSTPQLSVHNIELSVYKSRLSGLSVDK